MANEFKVGDEVWTKNIMFFVDGYNPNNGESIELRFDQHAKLVVDSINVNDGIIECKTQSGMMAYMEADSIEVI